MNAHKKNHSSITQIFKELFLLHPREFIYLFCILFIEGFIASISIITIAPLADYLVDPSLNAPNKITILTLNFLSYFGIEGSLLVFSSLFIIANFIKGFFEIGIKFLVLWIKYTVEKSILSDLIKTFFEARWPFFSEGQKGKLLNSFNREITIVGDTLGHLTMQLAYMFQLFIYLVIPLWINPQMTSIALITAIVLSIPFLFLHNLSYRLGQLNTKTANIFMALIYEMFSGARIIIGYSKQENTLKNFQKAFDNHISATIKSQTLVQAIQSLYQPIGISASVLALSISISLGSNLASSAIVLWSLFRLMPLIGNLLKTNINISNFKPSYEQIKQLKLEATINKENQGNINFKTIKKEIYFNNVSFSHSKRKQTINALNLKIKKNQMTAIVGESGSGKSTILDLLLGFQKPTEGQITFDNVNIENINMNSFRKIIGYVPQESYLFDGTIKDNLLWSNKDAKEADIISACKLAGAATFISELPNGFDTHIGDNASLFSGGQKQRLSLARALIRKPKIIILDEATSALDAETEREIQKMYQSLTNKITTIIVAHRFSTIIDADRIYVMRKGSIVESGSYSFLTEKKGSLFNKMLSFQNDKNIKYS